MSFSTIRTHIIDSPSQASAAFCESLPILPVGESVKAQFGVSSPDNAQAVISSIKKASAHCLSGAARALVTNPIQKSSLMAAGFSFPGHTEFIASLCAKSDGPAPIPVMMITNALLRVVPVTIHMSLRDVLEQLTTDKIVETAHITHNALVRDFGIDAPRLAISGLNPHAGEDGKLGKEDGAIIRPAIDQLRALGVNADGPRPADTMFHEDARATYDAAICMYHDQALIPAKAIDFHGGVNTTLGLPIVRTSPDHGTALNIAGKGIARPDSLISALHLADETLTTAVQARGNHERRCICHLAAAAAARRH